VLKAEATGYVTGTVSDSSLGINLEGVVVSIESLGLETITDRSGDYELSSVPAGAQRLKFSYMGFQTQTESVDVVGGERSVADVDFASQVIDMKEMQITEHKIGQARAINMQKTSETLKNVVASDAFGRFPDQNAAEILSRLPGVSVENDQGEGRYVMIRGIDPDLSNVSINGVNLPSPESDTRRVALDVIPSDILDTLEVTKSVTPDMDGDAIGGSINIKTKSAFDYKDTVLQGTLQGQYSNIVDDFSGKVNLTYGDVNEQETIGWIGAISYQKRDFGSNSREASWSEEEGSDGKDYDFLEEIQYREYTITRERLGFSGALEFKPNDDALYYVRGIYNDFSDQEYRQRTKIDFSKGDIAELGADSATIEGVNKTQKEIKDRYESQTVYSISTGGEISANEWDIDFGIAYSHAQEDEPGRLDTKFETSKKLDQDYSYVLDGNYNPVVSYLGGDAGGDPFVASSYGYDETVKEDNITKEKEWELNFNARKEMELASNPGYFKTGLKYRSKKKMADHSVYENDESPDLTLEDFVHYSTRYPYFNDAQGRYLGADPYAFRDYWNSNLDAFAMELNEEDSNIEDYESTEEVLSGYLMAGVTSGDWEWTGGFRVERTEFESTGMTAVFDEEGDFDLDASSVSTASRSYTDILPGIHAKFSPDDNAVFRMSLNKSLARPKFGDSANRSEYNLSDAEEIKMGNPYLDPYEAWNFDISYEYYLNDLGIISVSGFAKKVDDFIYSSVTEVPNPDDPASEVDFITPLNGESADVYGLEISYIQAIPVIDGLSFYSNLTLMDSEAELGADADRDGSTSIDFPGTSDMLGTLALSYEKQGFFIRLAGTYRSEYLQDVGDEPSEDEFIDSHFQWDLSTSYKVNKHVKVFAEFVNLNGADLRAYYGDASKFRQVEEYSWSANFGVKWKL